LFIVWRGNVLCLMVKEFHGLQHNSNIILASWCVNSYRRNCIVPSALKLWILEIFSHTGASVTNSCSHFLCTVHIHTFPVPWKKTLLPIDKGNWCHCVLCAVLWVIIASWGTVIFNIVAHLLCTCHTISFFWIV